jgi:hypothetical protein
VLKQLNTIRNNEVNIHIWIAVSLLFFSYPLVNTDMWWHLASAREMWVQKQFLWVDPFSWTTAGEWLNIHWLWQLLLYGIWKSGEFFGGEKLSWAFFFFFKLQLWFLSLFFLFRSYDVKKMTWFQAFTLWGVLWSIQWLVLLRPILLTLVWMSLQIFAWRKLTGWKRWLTLLITQILWVNTQGLFLIGPFMVWVYARWVGEEGSLQVLKYRVWSFVALLSISIINPAGLIVLHYPWGLLRRILPWGKNEFSRGISENIPLWQGVTANGSAQYISFFIWSILFFVLLLAIAQTFRKTSNLKAISSAILELWLLLWAFLALSAERNLLIFVWLMLPWWLQKQDFWNAVQEKFYFQLLSKILFVGVLLSSLHNMGAFKESGFLAERRVSRAAVHYIDEHFPKEWKIFHGARDGSMMTWELHEKRKVFLDGRFILRENKFMSDFLSLLEEPSSLDIWLRNYPVNAFLLPVSYYSQYKELAKQLYRSSEWNLVYFDGQSVIYVHRNFGIDKLRFDEENGRRIMLEQAQNRIVRYSLQRTVVKAELQAFASYLESSFLDRELLLFRQEILR